MRRKSLRGTGQTCIGSETSGSADNITLSASIASSAAFPAKIFPTPAKGQDLMEPEADSSSRPFAWFANYNRTEEGSKRELERGKNVDLGMVVKLFPTPTATDGKGAGKTGSLRDRLDYATERGATKSNEYDSPPPTGGQLNPTWVEWLMGVPKRVDRLRCLGNAIVPQVAEVVARMTMDRLTGGE